MKKIFPFLSLVIFLSFSMVSCGSKDPYKKALAFQTLEERYPGWANLTWISTDKGKSDFPRMEISIHNNVVTVRQQTSDTATVSNDYTMMFFFGNSLTLEDKNKRRLTAFYWKTDSTILIRTRGLVNEFPDQTHAYLLKKN